MVDCVVELFSCTCESKNGLYSWVALLSVLIQEYIIYRNSYLRVITWPKKKKKLKKVKSKNWHVTVSALCSYFNRLLCFRTCALYNPRNDPDPEMIPKSTPEWCRPRNDPQIDPEMSPISLHFHPEMLDEIKLWVIQKDPVIDVRSGDGVTCRIRLNRT